ncbi:MAG: regulatory protein RecX [Patescibacteria group bacterium]|jgi:regulatory protein
MLNQQLNQAIIYSQKLLAQYPRTVFEIEDKLKKKNCQPEIITQVIKYLKDKNYLNDNEYGKTFLEFELKNRPCGRMLCYKKLVKKGISKDLASQVLDENYPDEKEIELAKILADKKMRELKFKDKKTIYRKLGYYLNSKGFSSTTILEIIENF